MITLETADLAPREAYRLLAAAVTPRPIAWVTSVGQGGVVNLAPFSSYTFLAYDPPLVGISVGPGTSLLKDTLAHVRTNREFVVNAVTPDLVQLVADSSRRYPAEISEAQDLGIELAPCRLVAPPRVAAAPISLECVVDRIVDLEDKDEHRLVVGHVLMFHITEDIWAGDRIDPLAFRPIGRIGGKLYVRAGEIIRGEPTKDERFG
jgi:flavin reductase (DIM6/NTAB) family NADH-FMN oxidoreductase RutF